LRMSSKRAISGLFWGTSGTGFGANYPSKTFIFNVRITVRSCCPGGGGGGPSVWGRTGQIVGKEVGRADANKSNATHIKIVRAMTVIPRNGRE